MAAQNKLFHRLIWLVDTIYSAKEISREEIDRRWAHSVYNDTFASEYGERNFHRHKAMIYEMFGIEIICNRINKTYSLTSLGDINHNEIRTWLINTFAINNTVNLAGNMQDKILFEPIPEGTRYLSTIVTAIQAKHQLMISYKRFDKAESHSFLLQPYCLKVFRQRWYMIGKPEDHPEEKEPRVYALDRVIEIESTEKTYRIPKDFNPQLFFQNQFGVDRRITKAENIRLRVTADTAHYIRTLPLHDSQKEVERNAQYSIFTYHIAPTYDLIQELRKHGTQIEVLEPTSLRELFRRESKQLCKLYENN